MLPEDVEVHESEEDERVRGNGGALNRVGLLQTKVKTWGGVH